MERKFYDLKALDVDAKNRLVKVGISRMANKDRDGDIITPGAFNETILAKGPTGSNEIWHLTDHGWRIADSALSKYQEMGVQDDILYGVAPYRDTWLWREVAWPLYEGGDINQHSIGFRVVKEERPDPNGPRLITAVELWEGSAVLWGANPDTPVLDLVKSHIANKRESFEDRVKWICKAVKSGKYKEDESLLILELRELEELHKKTHPREGGPAPERDEDSQKLMLGLSSILAKY
jgi:HK97 family phage prohead protease